MTDSGAPRDSAGRVAWEPGDTHCWQCGAEPGYQEHDPTCELDEDGAPVPPPDDYFIPYGKPVHATLRFIPPGEQFYVIDDLSGKSQDILEDIAHGRTPACLHCGNRGEHNPWCIILQGGRPDD